MLFRPDTPGYTLAIDYFFVADYAIAIRTIPCITHRTMPLLYAHTYIPVNKLTQKKFKKAAGATGA
jgi:hypothetical protein